MEKSTIKDLKVIIDFIRFSRAYNGINMLTDIELTFAVAAYFKIASDEANVLVTKLLSESDE